jgi:hypothetical protein
MIESFENAKEELKRIDHLIYVTLKYTRTVDVLMSVVERMINCYEYLIEAMVRKALHEKKIEEIPGNPLAKANLVLELHSSKTVKETIEKYLMFRKLRRAAHSKSNEFRRHVTMVTTVDDEEIKVDIDSITEDFHELKKVIEFVDKLIK